MGATATRSVRWWQRLATSDGGPGLHAEQQLRAGRSLSVVDP